MKINIKLFCHQLFFILIILFCSPTWADEKESISAQSKHKAVDWSFLRPYSAIYDVISEKDHVGQATRKLTNNNANWSVLMDSKIKKWFLSLKSTELAEFSFIDNKLRTNRYLNRRKVSLKSEKTIEQLFDWKSENEMVKKNKESKTYPLSEKLYDRISHLIELRALAKSGESEANFNVSYKGKRKNYQYQSRGEETLKTKIGTLKTIKFVRTSQKKGENFSVWFCPDLDFIPVKIEKLEQDKPDIQLLINQYHLL